MGGGAGKTGETDTCCLLGDCNLNLLYIRHPLV